MLAPLGQRLHSDVAHLVRGLEGGLGDLEMLALQTVRRLAQLVVLLGHLEALGGCAVRPLQEWRGLDGTTDGRVQAGRRDDESARSVLVVIVGDQVGRVARL